MQRFPQVGTFGQIIVCLILATSTSIHAQSQSRVPLNCSDRLKYETPETANAVRQFWQKFQIALKNNDKQTLAVMMKYPLSVNSRYKYKIKTAQEFAGHYQQIFPEKMRLQLLNTPIECLSRFGYRGFSVTLGQIWFDAFPDNNWKIFAINVFVYESGETGPIDGTPQTKP